MKDEAAGMSASVTAWNAATPSASVIAVTCSADMLALFPRLYPATDPGPATPPFRRMEKRRNAICQSVEASGSVGVITAPSWRLT